MPSKRISKAARTLEWLTRLFNSRGRGATLFALAVFAASSSVISAQYGAVSAAPQYGRGVSKTGVGIDQKLNASIPLDLMFRDESNQPVVLRSYFGEKPVVLALVYYRCPGLCGLTLSDMVHSLGQVDLKPAEDYNAVIVSIDPAEQPPVAAAKKAAYRKLFARPSFDAGWHFLTGDQEAIGKLAAAVGFRYRWDAPTHQFVHAAGIMIVTPAGKLSRYFYGIHYTPTDVRLSLVEASKHKIGSAVDELLLYCCPFDPLTGEYTVAIYKILELAGAGTILCLAILVFYLIRSGKKGARHAVPL